MDKTDIVEFLEIQIKCFTSGEIAQIQRKLDITDQKFADIMRVTKRTIESYKAPLSSVNHREPGGSGLVLLYWLYELSRSGRTWKNITGALLHKPVKKFEGKRLTF